MEMAQFIEEEIKAFVRNSPLNHMPIMDNPPIYDEPLVGFADGDDPIFTEYKTIIAPAHLTPREALAKTFNKSPEDMPSQFSVISWILPVTSRIRESNRRHTVTPSRLWASVEYYGEYIFLEAMQEHLVEFLTKRGYLAVAPAMEPYFKDTMMELKLKGEEWDIARIKEKGISNWSEKHIAYAAGLGTLSFSGNFISERGVAITIGSVVTSLVLPASQRTAENPYSNCLFYTTGTCKACADRCPVGAITENGHDDIKCANHLFELHYLEKRYNIERAWCGMCMTKVPCEFRNPVRTRNKKKE
jgi:epoxyqueuosine reductase